MLKFFFVLALLFAYASCRSVEEAKLRYQNTIRTASEAVEARGCLAHVCFALDTSGSVTKQQFFYGRDFILDITAILGNDRRTKFAAGQYGRRTYKIASMTGDVATFNTEVGFSPYRHDSQTSVGSGIVFCHSQLRRARKKAADANIVNKMVVIGDGRNTLGGDPIRRANNFRRKVGGEISTVSIGYPGKEGERILSEVAGENGGVFTVDDYDELSEKVEDLVAEICGISLDL
ncbi:hypothetical protein BWQ96_05161 [Gracilariopsis chorda]|uniref:VWFA domain-containing protein n=1 Tax=Gracilariopsis chorda TaxID=448386 RepID=A0A2V3ISI4_9FLOR|nr:hypothetical protein BWQ96_10553 [Gracilariopsis chorda]PXF41670.1 hypothetical protein BWQ96_08591 [Gracilariopsis chorda]PXF45059.1 hypothetical protein BWQ96_05161 [Gracilariopsis chorda]|eukprot:PXF39744.1 hypothetical protein BWQ96_10553 [Gracilariopsis chorda]